MLPKWLFDDKKNIVKKAKFNFDDFNFFVKDKNQLEFSGFLNELLMSYKLALLFNRLSIEQYKN